MAATSEAQAVFRRLITEVPNYPKPGILFKDITTLVGDPSGFALAIVNMITPWRDAGITHVVGMESRGFIFGAPVALGLQAAFVPVRKPGKLPRTVLREAYALEYGTDALEMHADAMPPGARVLIVDDVLATGGTALAASRLIQNAGGSWRATCSSSSWMRWVRAGSWGTCGWSRSSATEGGRRSPRQSNRGVGARPGGYFAGWPP